MRKPSRKGKATRNIHKQQSNPKVIVEDSQIKQQELALHNLEEALFTIYQEVPLAQMLTGLRDEKQLAQMLSALTGTLDTIPIEKLTSGLFENQQDTTKFSQDLTSVLHGLKNLSLAINKNLSKQ